MKKMFIMLLIAILTLSTAAFAATYTHDDDITFRYDDAFFKISMDDHGDDEDLIILDDQHGGFVRIHLRDLDDGETFPTIEDFSEIEAANGTKVEKLAEWAGFTDVFTYGYNVDAYHEDVFIAPIYDDDHEIDAILTVNIGGDALEDEAAGMERADMVSEVVDTLKVKD